MPVPKDCQVAPFQRATRLAGCPPALSKSPPTTSSETCGPLPSGSHEIADHTWLSTPRPSGSHSFEFHRATRFTGVFPELEKAPPAISARGAGPSGSQVVSVRTSLLRPAPKAVQLRPSQAATRFTTDPPAETNHPPAASRSGEPPTPSGSNVESAQTQLETPVPNERHEPSHSAMQLTDSVPAVPKSPPATRDAADGPSPSESHAAREYTSGAENPPVRPL